LSSSFDVHQEALPGLFTRRSGRFPIHAACEDALFDAAYCVGGLAILALRGQIESRQGFDLQLDGRSAWWNPRRPSRFAKPSVSSSLIDIAERPIGDLDQLRLRKAEHRAHRRRDLPAPQNRIAGCLSRDRAIASCLAEQVALEQEAQDTLEQLEIAPRAAALRA